MGRVFDTGVRALMTTRKIGLAGLYVSEKGRIGRLVSRIVGHQAMTEDLVHDAFVKMLGMSPSDEICSDKAYLARIARNLAIDEKRRQREVITLDDEALFALADPSPSPETIAADRQALAITMAAIQGLPERTRRALEMHRLGEHTLAQIGKTLGISTALAGRLVLDGYRVVRDRLREAEGS